VSVEEQVEWSAGPLPSGRHGLSREYVLAAQRTRLLGAALDVAGTAGYAAMSVSAVTRRAGVSRKTFYELFEDREACFLAVYDRLVACALEGIRAAYDGERAWPERVRAMLTRLLGMLSERPHEARVAFVEVYAAGAAALARRDATLAQVAPLFDPDAKSVPDRRARSPLLPEAVVGALAEVIYARVLRGQTRELPALLPDLQFCALAPFLGPTAAAQLAGTASASRRRRKGV
jgi:AcrR family transcriptional regulator